MKNILKITSLSLILVSLLLTTGCSSTNSGSANKNSNFLGIAKISPKSFNLDKATSFNVHTNELMDRPNVSGDELSLLWGLIKIQDY